jgi:uncharacterized spore protein YtfJ
MRIDELLDRAREAMTGRLVYAEPYEKDGLTIIPAARVVGGGGGGTGQDRTGRRGDGGGMGLVARPVGAFVIHDGEVRWVPAVDVNRLAVTIAGLVAGGWLVGRRRRG